MRKSTIAAVAILAASFAIGLYFYPQMPETMPSHWNSQGEVDGYTSRFWGLFLMPFVISGIFLLFIAIPRIDPMRYNIEKFRGHYGAFMAIVMFFMMYVHALTIAWALGYKYNMMSALSPAMGVLFFFAGVLVEKAERNWFVGIRTPWTLSSEEVWKKTHRIGGKMFKISGIICAAGFLLPSYAIYLVLVPALFTAIFTVVYSYFAYRKEKEAA